MLRLRLRRPDVDPAKENSVNPSVRVTLLFIYKKKKKKIHTQFPTKIIRQRSISSSADDRHHGTAVSGARERIAIFGRKKRMI